MSAGTSVRIYDLARELKQDTKRVIEELRREGADVSIPSNSVSKELAEKVRNKYFPKTEAAPRRLVKVIRKEAVTKTEEPIEDADETAKAVASQIEQKTAQNTQLKIEESLVNELKVDCQDCLKSTKHNLLYSADVPDVEWSEKYQIVQCKRCEGLSFRRTIFENNKNKIDVYPSRIEGRKKLDLEYIPPIIGQIYEEIHLALSNRLLIVATTGMRTLIERVCIDQGSQAKNLMGKIDDLVSMQKLTLKNANNLHKLRDFGNDAAHEANIQPEETLKRCIDIIEHLLEDIYLPEISS